MKALTSLITLVFLTAFLSAQGPATWSSSASYTHPALVIDGTTTYISLQDVPANTAITNTSYWATLDSLVPTETPSGADSLTAPDASEVENLTVPDSKSSDSSIRLANISTRGYVGTGDSSMIVSIIVEGSGSKTVTIRALGPVLASFGVADSLSDPFLSVTNQATGAELVSNDNWQTASSASAVTSSGKSEGIDAKESAVQLTLQDGQYSAVVTGVGGATGNALVEVYDED